MFGHQLGENSGMLKSFGCDCAKKCSCVREVRKINMVRKKSLIGEEFTEGWLFVEGQPLSVLRNGFSDQTVIGKPSFYTGVGFVRDFPKSCIVT